MNDAGKKLSEPVPDNSMLEHEFFGVDELKVVLNRFGTGGTEDIKAGILNELQSYSCNDDVTFIVLKRAS